MEKDFIKNLASRSTILRDFVESRKRLDSVSRIAIAAYPGNTRVELAARKVLFRLLKTAMENRNLT